MMKHSKGYAAAVVGGLLVFWSCAVMAYDKYSDTTTACKTCHDVFTKYDLHDVHRYDILSGDCDTCHTSGYLPVYIGHSAGGAGLAPVSCMGCHGRAEDATGTGTQGYGTALRHRHWRPFLWRGEISTRVCINCHADSDPAAATVVGEYVLPVYYAQPGTGHPDMPFDPCNRSPVYGEDFVFSTRGLDNDGDLMFDELDPDCTATPGEASGVGPSSLTVASYNAATEEISISYGAACAATDHHVEIGSLTPESLSTYAWTNRICNLGCTGAATFHPGADSAFFVIVGNNGATEGSYGRNSAGAERPEDAGSSGCVDIPRVLANRCD